MSFTISLTSDNRNANQDPLTSDFRTTFQTPIPLSDQGGAPIQYEVALINHNSWYSFPNISDAEYGNALFTYNNGVIDKNFIIPEGTYTFDALNDYIQAQITALGDVGTNIDFTPNFATLRTTLTIAGGYSVDFAGSNLYLLFGFSAAQAAAPIAVTTISDNVADITNGVDSLLIRMDILSGTYDNQGAANVLYTYVPDKPPGSNIFVNPNTPVYVSMNLYNDLTNFRIYITDQQNRRVNFRGETISYLLSFKPV